MDNKLFGDHTDYTHLTFDDLSKYLENKALTIEYYLNFIEKDKKEVEESGYWTKKVFSNFVYQANDCITLYNSTKKELRDIKNEIENEVKLTHYNRLIRIAHDSNKINRRLGTIWHQEYELKDYGNEDFQKVERIYSFTRDVSVTLTDLGNFAERLKDFVGRVNVTNKSKWERSHKIALASLVVASIVLLFGNNLVEKYQTISFSNLLTKKPIVESKEMVETQNKEIILEKSIKLPYLDNYPIIDKGLYIKYYYADLQIGGVNIDQIKLNARTKLSNPLQIENNKGFVSLDISEEPFIEIEYKNKFYSIEVLGQHYDFTLLLKVIPKPTMNLVKPETK